jgi:hypothetical protein
MTSSFELKSTSFCDSHNMYCTVDSDNMHLISTYEFQNGNARMSRGLTKFLDLGILVGFKALHMLPCTVTHHPSHVHNQLDKKLVMGHADNTPPKVPDAVHQRCITLQI